MQVKTCELYFDSEASYRAVHRQLGIAPYRLFKIIDALGANRKSTIDGAKDLKPDWSSYLFIDEKRIYTKDVEWFLLLAVDLGTQDIVHWDLFEVEDSVNVAWLLIIIKIVMSCPFKGLISDLLPEFYGTSRWLLPGIPHQLYAYKATEGYIKYRYKGGNKF